MDEESIFLQALQIESPAERSVFLGQECGNDTELRKSLDSLLISHDASSGFLERPHLAPEQADGGGASTVTMDDQSEKAVSLDFLTESDAPGSLGRLGIYEVLEVLGRGGMGIVLKAQDTKLNRIVAIKALAPEFSAHSTARKRFLREAQAAAAVAHPHVVTIHAVDEADQIPYLVMECIDGKTLQQKIEHDGTLTVVEILRIGSQIAQGLAAAHAQGLVHRDVKPANILLENGIERVKITDFGLARAIDDVAITKTGDVIGTPLFMSPEQAQGGNLDHRSDLFSLGSVLYLMCTGRSAFRADSSIATLRRVCDDIPRPIRDVNPEIPQWLEEIISRLMNKNRDERFQTAHEVADLLEQHLAHVQSPSDSQPPRPFSKTETKAKPRRFARWLVAGVLLLAVGLTESTGVTDLTGAALHFFRPKTDAVVIDKAFDDKEQSFVNQEQTKDKSPSEKRDTQPTLAIITATEILTSDEWEWTEPESLGPNVNSEHTEGGPHLSADGLTLLFHSNRPGGQPGPRKTNYDLWMSRRASLDDPFDAAENLGATINSRSDETHPTMSADGLTLVFGSKRKGSAGEVDLWMSTRSSDQDQWSPPVNLGPKINGKNYDNLACLSGDGLKLWYNSFIPQGGEWSLRMSQRSSGSSSWAKPITLESGVGTGRDLGFISSVTFSGDELVRMHSMRGLRMDVRATTESPWKSIVVPGVVLHRGGVTNQYPSLSADGRILVYKKSPLGKGDLWMNRRVKKE